MSDSYIDGAAELFILARKQKRLRQELTFEAFLAVLERGGDPFID